MSVFRTINEVEYADARRTVMVLGCGRGGTSALAGGLRELGVAMPNAHPLKHEWSPVGPGENPDFRAIRRNIGQINQEHRIWGWKSPRDVFLADQILPMLTNPVVFIVVRNIVDVSESMMRHSVTEFEIGFNEAVKAYESVGKFINETIYPALVVSYEKLLDDPTAFFEFASAWSGINAGEEKVEAAAKFVSGDVTYKKVSSELRDLSFSRTELDRDQVNSFRATYPVFISAYARSVSAAEDDIKHLYVQLKHHRDRLFVAAKERCDAIGINLDPSIIYQFSELDRNIFSEVLDLRLAYEHRKHEDDAQSLDENAGESQPADVPVPQTVTEEEYELARLYHKSYLKARQNFIDIKKQRQKLQRDIDDIIEKQLMIAEAK